MSQRAATADVLAARPTTPKHVQHGSARVKLTALIDLLGEHAVWVWNALRETREPRTGESQRTVEALTVRTGLPQREVERCLVELKAAGLVGDVRRVLDPDATARAGDKRWRCFRPVFGLGADACGDCKVPQRTLGWCATERAREDEPSRRGGKRPGAGRPKGSRDKPLPAPVAPLPDRLDLLFFRRAASPPDPSWGVWTATSETAVGHVSKGLFSLAVEKSNLAVEESNLAAPQSLFLAVGGEFSPVGENMRAAGGALARTSCSAEQTEGAEVTLGVRPAVLGGELRGFAFVLPALGPPLSSLEPSEPSPPSTRQAHPMPVPSPHEPVTSPSRELASPTSPLGGAATPLTPRILGVTEGHPRGSASGLSHTVAHAEVSAPADALLGGRGARQRRIERAAGRLHRAALGLPCELVPQAVSVAKVARCIVPDPPKLDPADSKERHAQLIASWYEGAFAAALGKRCWAFGRGGVKKSKWFPLLTKAAAAFIERDIAPAAWLEWSIQVWREFMEKDGKPLAVGWMLAPERIRKPRGWHSNQETDSTERRLVIVPAAAELMRRQRDMEDELRSDAPVTDADVRQIVARHFAPGEHTRLVETARREAESMQADLRSRAHNGGWLWG